MPELPEVETVRRGLAPVLDGRTITHVALRREGLRKPFPAGLARKVNGKKVLSVDRRAKYLLVTLSGGSVLIIHLGMTGRLFVRPADHENNIHDHMELTLDNGAAIVFNDARRFGQVDLIDDDELDTYPAFKAMGPEPLEASFTPAMLAAELAGRKTSFKAALMDQRTVAGLGNIYVCEALFRSRIDPRRLAGTMSKAEAGRLVPAIREVLNEAIASGGSTLRDYVNARGAAGYFQHRFDVYDRDGKPCRNNAAHVIRRIVQNGRSTFYCPKCQK
jgi:formamidopyrimidine-DNA glycosylase